MDHISVPSANPVLLGIPRSSTERPRQEGGNDVRYDEPASRRIILDCNSDYGSEPEEEEREIIEGLLRAVGEGGGSSDGSKSGIGGAEDTQERIGEVEGPEGGEPQLRVIDIEDYEAPRGVRLPKVRGFEQKRERDDGATQLKVLRDVEVQSAATHPEHGNTDGESREKSPSVEPEAQYQPAPRQPDMRSPLERFRRPPKKALSVTDLVSPAWCELQYFYTLSKHGRKKRTVAMKQGSKVHQELEEEIHVTVPVEVTKVEDSWGLRIWNIIQGLRTLREGGKTRELEVWGTVGGEIVNGIIDEVGYECPDPRLKDILDGKNGKKQIGPELPEYQTRIEEYLTSGAKAEGSSSIEAALSTKQPAPRKEKEEKQIYITDVKTRTTPTLPAGSSTRPTILQLHLYHHMLENLAQGNFSLVQLAERYKLNTEETFSDSFIAQVGNLNQELFEATSSQGIEDVPSSEDSIEILLQHSNLSSLWDYMIQQFRQTFLLPNTRVDGSIPTSTPQSVADLPSPSQQPTRLSPILTAEYIASNYRHAPGTAKKYLGRKSFVFNAGFLKSYLEDNLAWWRGEREAKGVELQEAWKCRSCDFRDDCEWLHERDRDALEKVLKRKVLRDAGGVKETKEDREVMGEMGRSKV